jgi:hypothetical protein
MSRFLTAILAVMLGAAGLPPGDVRAADPVMQSCPLLNRSYKAQLKQDHLTGAAGEAVILTFVLDPAKPPVGFFLSVNMNLIQSPESAKVKKPEILTGFPETTAVFRTPGTYRYAVMVSLIAKSSCGGVKADTIFNGEVRINISP